MARRSLDSTTEIDLLAGRGSSGHRHVLLVVREDGASSTHPLPESGAVVVGRGDDCEVRLEDPALSRRHAAIHLGSVIEVEDLGSANGTRVREASGEGVDVRTLAPRRREPLSPGAVLELGTLTALVQVGPSSGRPRRVWSHGGFEALVEKEHERTQRTRAPFAVLHVIVQGLSPQDAEAQVVAATRGSDTVGAYGPSQLEVLVVDADAAGVDEVRRRVDARITLRGGQSAIGVARHPEDGRSPEALLEAARQRARGEEPVERPARVVVLEDPAMKRLYRLAKRVADSRISVLLLGETGVGKDVVAEAIHALSSRAKGPFLRLNCAALPENLLESELFGHEKGAFSGAHAAKPGLLESASSGTVFLDEVGEIPLATQAKLLRALEEGQVRRVGALSSRAVDVRFVAATNRDLEAEVDRGTFRGDLFFRLSGVTLAIPPLRERPSEIVPFARAFLADLARAAGREPPTLAPDAEQFLLRYAWPGNIRELRNVVERALLLSDGPAVLREHLPVEKLSAELSPQRRSPLPPRPGAPVEIPPPAETQRLPDFEGDTARISRPELDEALRLAELRAKMDEAEKRRIEKALDACAGNQTKAAKLLGISRGTLVSRLDAYGMPRPRKP